MYYKNGTHKVAYNNKLYFIHPYFISLQTQFQHCLFVQLYSLFLLPSTPISDTCTCIIFLVDTCRCNIIASKTCLTVLFLNKNYKLPPENERKGKEKDHLVVSNPNLFLLWVTILATQICNPKTSVHVFWGHKIVVPALLL